MQLEAGDLAFAADTCVNNQPFVATGQAPQKSAIFRSQNVNVCVYLTMTARKIDSGPAGRPARVGARSVSSPSL
jgi:hypothetical protein